MVVLDPFCGCGTTVAAAQKLNRQWLGIDVTHLAVALMKSRLKTAFNLDPGADYAVVGEPRDVGSARALWEQDPYQFQFWAVSLLEVQPQGEQRRGADRGIDGIIYFVDGPRRTPQKGSSRSRAGGSPRPKSATSRAWWSEKRRVGPLHLPGRPHPGYACRGGRRRLLPLGTVAAGFPQNPDPHHRRPADRGFDLPPRQPMYQPAEGEQGALEELAGD